MNEEIFTVISAGDGITMYRLRKSELLEKLNEGYWGNRYVWGPEVFDSPNDHVDLMATGGLFIVRGDLTKPYEKKTVTQWGL